MSDIQGWMGEASLAWLRERAAESARVIEVGAWKGRSTRALAEGGVTVWAVDTWQGVPDDPHQQRGLYAETGRADIQTAFLYNLAPYLAAGRVIPLRLSSLEAADVLRHAAGTFDFVFIDADHRYEAVAADIAAYRPLLRHGGLLAGHDYAANWPGVRQAVDEAFGGAATVGPETIWSIRP